MACGSRPGDAACGHKTRARTRVRLEEGAKPVWCGCGADSGGSRRAGLAWMGSTGIGVARRRATGSSAGVRGRLKEVPTGGAHLEVRERGGGGLGREKEGWAGGRGNWASGKEERKKGRAEILGRKRNFFFFPNSLKQIQIKFKLKEFEFKLNHKHLKQCKIA